MSATVPPPCHPFTCPHECIGLGYCVIFARGLPSPTPRLDAAIKVNVVALVAFVTFAAWWLL